MILKPSPQTPTVVEQVSSIFLEAGLPRNVLQYFHCGSLVNLEAIIRSPLINHICFTGSVAGGLAVQKAAADRIVNVGLELGGNDAAYVRQDVDLAWVAEEIVDGAIFNSGQSCCSIERVYVHEKVHDAFIQEIKKVLSNYRVGDPFDEKTQIGPVISQKARENILSHIEDAIKGGARDETPANSTFDNLPPVGNFVKPTLLTGVTHSMRVMAEETFGPVIPVMKVKDDSEAIRWMNDSDLGLTASVWTKDVATGEKLIQDIEAGTVFINRADYPSPVSFVEPPVLRCAALFCAVLQLHDTPVRFIIFFPFDSIFYPYQVSWHHHILTSFRLIGPCMDRMEEFRKRCYPQQIWFRPVHQAEKLPPEGLSKIELLRLLCLDLHLMSYMIIIFNSSCTNISLYLHLVIHPSRDEKFFQSNRKRLISAI